MQSAGNASPINVSFTLISSWAATFPCCQFELRGFTHVHVRAYIYVGTIVSRMGFMGTAVFLYGRFRSIYFTLYLLVVVWAMLRCVFIQMLEFVMSLRANLNNFLWLSFFAAPLCVSDWHCVFSVFIRLNGRMIVYNGPSSWYILRLANTHCSHTIILCARARTRKILKMFIAAGD